MIWLAVAILGVLVFVVVIVPAGLLLVVGRGGKDWRGRVAGRYRERYRWGDLIGGPGAIFAWVFAMEKMKWDPMFSELPGLIEGVGKLETVLDIGCGFGVTGCALLEWKEGVRVFGVDPNRGRVKVAREVFGRRGEVFVAGAPDFVRHGMPERVDLVMVLDVIHFIGDAGLAVTLERVRGMLGDGGLLIVRAIVPPVGKGSIWWRIAKFRRMVCGGKAYHRSVEEIRGAMERAGFEITDSKSSGGNAEMWWVVGK